MEVLLRHSYGGQVGAVAEAVEVAVALRPVIVLGCGGASVRDGCRRLQYCGPPVFWFQGKTDASARRPYRKLCAPCPGIRGRQILGGERLLSGAIAKHERQHDQRT